MPLLLKQSSVLFNNCTQFGQLVRLKAAIAGQSDGIDPEFRVAVIAFRVDMRRFARFTAEEKEPIRTLSQYRRHCSNLSSNWLGATELRFDIVDARAWMT
jgi:hypothetical protein